nr:uncharacterized protein LOC129279036 [Lytechinus pictus]
MPCSVIQFYDSNLPLTPTISDFLSNPASPDVHHVDCTPDIKPDPSPSIPSPAPHSPSHTLCDSPPTPSVSPGSECHSLDLVPFPPCIEPSADPSPTPVDTQSLYLSDPDSFKTSPISQPPTPSPCHCDEFLPVSEVPPDIYNPKDPQHVNVPISSPPLSPLPSPAPSISTIDFEEDNHDLDACSDHSHTPTPPPPPPPNSTPPPPVPHPPNIAPVAQMKTVLDKATALGTDPVNHGNDLGSLSQVSTDDPPKLSLVSLNKNIMNTLVIPAKSESISFQDNVALYDPNYLSQASNTLHTHCHLSSLNFPDPVPSYGLHHGFTPLILLHGPGPPFIPCY